MENMVKGYKYIIVLDEESTTFSKSEIEMLRCQNGFVDLNGMVYYDAKTGEYTNVLHPRLVFVADHEIIRPKEFLVLALGQCMREQKRVIDDKWNYSFTRLNCALNTIRENGEFDIV